MPHVPPMVASLTAGGLAYLLAWEKLPDGSWGAHIAWVQLETGGAWLTKSARVVAGDITQLDGVDYSKVPRRTV